MNKLKKNIFYIFLLFFISSYAQSKDSNEKLINITSDELINRQNPPISEFNGNVYAYDEINHFWSDKMVIKYDEDKNIKLITLENNVKIKRGNEETTGDFASYDPKSEFIEVIGEVVVLKEGNVLIGDKLTIDLISSTSIITSNKTKKVSVKIVK